MRHLIITRVSATALAIALLGSCGGSGSGSGSGSGTSNTQTLTITADSPPAGTTGQAYPGYTFTASGGTPPLSWTMSTASPPGLSLSTSGQLSGIPATAGTYAFSVTVSDSSAPPLTTNASVSLKINDSMIVVAPAAPLTGTVTYQYPGFSFSASGGSPPYIWTSSGTLPPGLTLGSDGTVSGTPTQVGSFAFSVTATDSAQPPMSGAPLATHIDINAPSKLTLNAMPVPPAGVVGTPYGPFSFSTSGGYLPFQWSVTGGALPPGLTLGNDGSLNGTPTSAGPSFAFTVTVTDSAPKAVSSSLPFAISVTLPLPPTIDDQEAPTGTVGSAYAPYQFTASNGVTPLNWSETPSLTMGLSLSSAGVLSGTPTAAGQFPITLNVMDAVSRSAPPFPMTVRVSLARPPASFTFTGSMEIARSGHAATLLLSGKVLVTGGGNGTADATAELYDPAAGTFSSSSGNMTEPRIGHTATLLKLSNPAAANYGKVLIVGSTDLSAELYDPTKSTFAATGSMHHTHTSPTATLLNTGKVLIVGGNTASGDLTAELYDPASGTFSDTGSTTILRAGHTATLLLDGRVLIAGGGAASAELYNPSSGTFTATAGSMTEARSGHTATLLGAADGVQDGYVLIIGTDGTADLYSPATETFERIGSLPVMRPSHQHTASPRTDGTVLASGGGLSFWRVTSLSAAALFAPESDGFTTTGSLNTSRYAHTATTLGDGAVLIVGGTHATYQCVGYPFFTCRTYRTILSSAELFR
jgi:hypothetical protein